LKSTKIIIIALYTLIVVCIGFATVIEKYRGTAFVSEYVYGAWWFSALWAVLTIAALAYIMKQRLYKRFAVMLLHLSFVVILAGALSTHLFARRGTVRLRTNISETTFVDKDNKIEHLPFILTLKEFRIINYPGTDAPLDYQSVIQFTVNRKSKISESKINEVLVSMNNIGNIDGYRLFQQSYDADEEGVTLGVSYDPYGIAITYFGYLMLLVGIIATLLSRHTQMRALYRKAMRPIVLLFTIHYSLFTSAAPLPAVDADIAHRMGTINVLYNNRICPLNTVATDFTMKLTGSATWNGYSADEVFFSWMIYYMPWEKELLLNFPKKKGTDERKAIVEMFYNGQFTKIFPYPLTSITWYSPGGQVLPREIPVKEQFFIKQSMDFLTEAIVTGQRDRAFEIIAKIKLFQREMIGDVLPSDTKTHAEIFYNKLRSIKFPVLITAQLGLRWWLSGHIPLSNGYETMLFMAWVLLVLTVVLFRKFRIILWIGPLAALCCLLVAMMTGSGSEITPLMPVLQSPLLSMHVMTVMCAYALFALQMLIGIYALYCSLFTIHYSLERVTALSQLLLYPAVFLLTIGIFLGAVWANVSWGNYWSWDPKESWALITLMVYAVPLHKSSIGIFRNPRIYHIYMISAFLAVLITYFGVNYLLGGMHSYA
jgi:ABC-type transport system involved in cytochrome c biogenesis permease subunit